jgi:NAD(P)-dependent dehydrogenase (short-subunit alcohol dehydrogenase family)
LQSGGAELLSETTLLHSHDEYFRGRLPIRLGLVRLDSGPSAVVFLDDGVSGAPQRVRVDVRLDKAGQGVLVAFAEGDVVTRTRLFREMSCDPGGRKVLVTDAATAPGVALVRALVDGGAEIVWAGCGSAAATRGGPEDLLGALEPVRFVSLDVTSDESAQAAADQIGSQVDILINNSETCAGLARAFVPAMQASSASASATDPMMAWVNLLSIDALTSKAASHSFAQSLRAEMLPAGIRVINVFSGSEIAPVALAQSIVKALQDGIEDLYPGEVAQEWLTRSREPPPDR